MSTNATNAETVITIRDLWKAFAGTHVHKGVSLDVKRGEIMTVIGGSGSGKSVLLREITGLIPPDSGSIMIGDEEVVGKKESRLLSIRKRVGMLFQGSALFDSMNVYENIAFPLREHTRLSAVEIYDVVQSKLAQVNLAGVSQMMPEELSGGMKKRVGLARALAIDPEIILYDEPTTGLDPTTAHRICHLIRRLRDNLGVTSMLVTHDLPSVRAITDRVAMLYDGKIIATGTWEEMVSARDPVVRHFIEGTLDED